jgi:hypothetical protein
VLIEAPDRKDVIGKVPEQKSRNDDAGREAVRRPNPTGPLHTCGFGLWRCRSRVGKRADPCDRPDRIFAVRNPEKEEQDASEREQGRRREGKMRQPTRPDLVGRLPNGGETEQRHARDKRRRNSHAKVRRQLPRRSRRLDSCCPDRCRNMSRSGYTNAAAAGP